VKLSSLIIIFLLSLSIQANVDCGPNFNNHKNVKAQLIGVTSFKKPNKSLELFSVKIDRTRKAIDRGAFEANSSSKMRHFKRYSFYKPNKNSPINIVNIYFHGRETKPAILLENVNLFNFLHKRFLDKDPKYNCLRKIQAHYSEYNSVSKIFTRQASSNASFNGKDFSQLTKLDEIKFFYDAYPLDEFILTNNSRGFGSFEFEWPGYMKGYFQIDPQYMNKLMSSYDGEFNCKDNEYNGFTNLTLGIEAHTTSYYAWKLPMSQASDGIFDIFFQWRSILSLKDYYIFHKDDKNQILNNKCNFDHINSLLTSPSSKTTSIKLKQSKGAIPFNEFSSETKTKAGFEQVDEPLSYILSPCFGEEKNKEMPEGFTPPRPRQDENSKEYWLTKPCQLSPHHFVNYKDIDNNSVYLSKREIDGTYPGKSHDWGSNKAVNRNDFFLLKDRSKRVLFNYEYLKSYRSIKVIENKDNISLILESNLNKNLFIGNIYKKDLENNSVIASSIGISPRPIISPYNSSVLNSKSKPLYSFFYDSKGRLLDHKSVDIGVEFYYLRKKGCDYTLDLISHERILPLKRYHFAYNCKI
jgi:hypothetical protein